MIHYLIFIHVDLIILEIFSFEQALFIMMINIL